MERLSMRKIKQVLRRHFEQGASNRRIATSTHISRASVAEYLRRFQQSGLVWPLPDSLSDTKLEQLLFPPAVNIPASQRPVPDWQTVYQDLKNIKNHTTLFLLWQEYKANPPHGYQYSWFCDQFRLWQGKLDVSMRQIHLAGDKLFVDYAGDTLPIIDRRTGEIKRAQIFVAVLGASHYTYAEATWSQSLPDWIASHQRMFTFFGGVPELLVPDNLKAAVSKADRYSPTINETYAELACHYQTAVLPARPYKPKDKAKAETSVLLVERWILARLRHQTFFSLAELNTAIAALLPALNQRPFQGRVESRQSLYDALDRPALRPLPATPYTYAEWRKARPGIDYHIEIDKRLYSVPHALVGLVLDVRLTDTALEVMHKGQRVALHPRHGKSRFVTLTEHMPKAHQAHKDWSPERFLNWAKDIGPASLQVVQGQLKDRPHPEHGYRACLGLLNLSRRYSRERLEQACARALSINSASYQSITSILKQGLDQLPLPLAEEERDLTDLPAHTNVRGPHYYH